MRSICITLAAGFIAIPHNSAAQTASADTATRIAWSAFVDSYYSHDFGRPSAFDRAYTTQPARHNEFNINLAHIEASLSGARIHGRVALQAGTSVQSNYGAEPRNGSVSGPELARSIQEAYGGFEVADGLWLDAGIFFSNMGMESWISRENLSYTRSLIADYSPYYSSGARVVWQATPAISTRVDVVNGWQNISETNHDKALGSRVEVKLSPRTTLAFYNYFGNETGGRLRVFNGLGLTATIGERLKVLAQTDVGTQEVDSGSRSGNSWWGYTLIARQMLTPSIAVVGRLERFDDPHRVIIGTDPGIPGFRANAASMGLDVMPHPKAMWRTEIRGYSGNASLFPDTDATGRRARSAGFVVTSMAFTF